MTLYFIGILQIIGLLNTIGMEIKSSLELIIFDNKRETDFYQNYININSGIPSFNLFFLSAIFSSTPINIFSFQGTVILILYQYHAL